MRTADLLHAARVAAENAAAHAATHPAAAAVLADPHVVEHALMLAQYAESLHALARLNDGIELPDEDQDDEPEFVEPPEVTRITTWGASSPASEVASGITLAANRAILGIDQIRVVQHALEEYVRPGIRRPKADGTVQAATALLVYLDETFGLA